jgi:hypothetical protein
MIAPVIPDTADAPEVADKNYRRGYTQGAAAILEAIGTGLTPTQRVALLEWINGDLTKWRYAVRPGSKPVTLAKPPPVPPTRRGRAKTTRYL